MNTNRLALSLLPAVILATSAMLLLTASTAYAGKPDKCSPWPACKDDGGDPPPPDPDPGSIPDPQVVYRQGGGIYLADRDGLNRTLIRSDDGWEPTLDAINKRVLFYDAPSYASDSYVGMIPYSVDVETRNIVVGEEQLLISAAQLGATLSPEGVSDWSPDGTKYSYSYRTQADPEGPWVHRMVVAPDPEVFPAAVHTEIYASEDDGGLNSATWDASGDFIFHQDNPLDGSLPNGLFVIDVTASPGNTVATLELGPIFVDAGFSEDSNVQRMSASYEVGGDHLIGPNLGAYSFDPGNPNVPASSETSLCLMLSVIDWSAKRGGGAFIVILDLVQMFDPAAWAAGLHCSIATNATPILDFDGTDFTTGDKGIVGRDRRKNRNTGVWVYDLSLSAGSRTKIVSEGGFPDWSN